MKNNNSYKFTLIELLVVFAIIGILSSFLLPSLAQARKKAQGSTCISNLRNFGTATLLYSDDNDGTLPYSKRQNGAQHLWWRNQLAAYLIPDDYITETAFNYPDSFAEGVFACPLTDNGINDYSGGGYGWNQDYLGNAIDQTTININEVEKPTETYASGDSADSPLSNWRKFVFSKASKGLEEIGDRHQVGVNHVNVDGSAKRTSSLQIVSGLNGDIDYYFRPRK
ncbi:type II secretion system protein [Lentisphaera profundi]|uniref:Type II secretion system protein n=1 Tax=Lentisphaera profundi TaxID=1658616 RepID=A0ABY7W2T9_9BACT|nr:type II secretion system protein [Lentisphaera profundi]WDE98593.1 type II secretion system protein [Lentisphaera profundi]